MQKKFQKFRIASTQPTNNKHIRARALTTSGILAAAIIMTGCSPTEGAQNEAANNANGKTQDVNLLNVSYDVSRDFYKDYNALFSADYQKAHPNSKVNINQSHGGSSKQALSVANGLQADVVTPNPKTSGTARYAFLGAYGYGLHQFKENSSDNPVQTNDFIKKLLANVVTYDNGARAATTSFTQRGLGDVLITTENEANLAAQQFAKGQVDIVYPSYSIEIANPVAVVTAVTDKAGKTEAATAYLKGLWDKPAQELMAKMYMRPSDEQILAAHKDTLPDIETFEPVAVFGPWAEIMDTFFVDGGRFDQLASAK